MKKLFLLIALLMIIPFYNAKAACISNITVEYVDLDELYESEAYTEISSEIETVSIDNDPEYTTYVIYGDKYTIKNKKINGLNTIAKYEDCYKEIVGKYAVLLNLHQSKTEEIDSLTEYLTNTYYYDVDLIKIVSSTNLECSYMYIANQKIDGKHISSIENCHDESSVCQLSINSDNSVNINIDKIKKQINEYKYMEYKIFEINNVGDYSPIEKIEHFCGIYVIRLYYKSTKQTYNETISLSKTKNVKMSAYFKDLKETSATITYRVLDSAIAKVDSNGNIVPLKVGETDIVAEIDGIEYILHLRITEDMLQNPDTTSPVIMLICVIGILISGTTIYLKDQTN